MPWAKSYVRVLGKRWFLKFIIGMQLQVHANNELGKLARNVLSVWGYNRMQDDCVESLRLSYMGLQ